MQTLSQPTIRSGIRAAVEVGLLLPRRQRPPLSLSLPNFLISLKSGKPKPLLSPFASYVPLHVKSSKLFSSRVSSSPVPPSSTSVNAETFKVVAEALEELNRQAKECGGFSNNICIDELDQERIRKAVLEYVREIQAEKEASDSLNYNICHHLANHVLQKNAAKGSNTLISPFSFHLLLSLIAAASKGHTLQQLFQCLKSESLEDLNSLSSKMISLASPTNGSSTGDPNLSFANGVWVSEGLKLEPSFQEIAEVVFNATAKEVDFVNNADRVVAEINVWAETATRGLIKNLLTSEALKSIDKDTALILANAIYFKGTWAQHFDTSKPKNRPFCLENGQTVDVPFMISEKYESCHYIDMGDFKILKLPFRNGQSIRNFAMYFFLPDAIDGLKKWVEMSEIGPEFFSRRFDDLPLVDIAEIISFVLFLHIQMTFCLLSFHTSNYLFITN
ncbi:hypothetical protein PTKIN_Ptkin09bG0249500 [Pterospermum kingtungense]